VFNSLTLDYTDGVGILLFSGGNLTLVFGVVVISYKG
jgi:hypothetical protein